MTYISQGNTRNFKELGNTKKEKPAEKARLAEQQVNKDVCIVGGGTAGWMTALLINTNYDCNVTLIESEDIGILGAGEGTTPQFITFLEEVKLRLSDIVANCSATVKHGIEFANWNGDGTSYFHSFNINDDFNVLTPSNILIIAKYLEENKDYNHLNFSNLLSQNYKTGFKLRRKEQGRHTELENVCSYALHFDARKLADYLKKVAIERDVVRIEGKVTQIKTDDKNYINELVLDNGKSITTDYVFDCTGFARLIIGKFFQTKWKSYANKLPLNSAIPFFLPHDNHVKPQTTAIAMKHGWMWQIPVKDRYGCGYVFDKNRVSSDEALAEAEQWFGQKLTSPRSFSFDAGSFENTVVNNCMAVGLAQSFVEPLEATSIWISLINLFEFINLDILRNDNHYLKNTFNKRCSSRNDEVAEFLHFHYLSERDDTPFWKEFKHLYPMTEVQKELVEQVRQTVMPVSTVNVMWGPSYTMVGLGIRQASLDFRKRYLEKTDLFKLFQRKEELVKRQQMMLESCILHKDFIENNF